MAVDAVWILEGVKVEQYSFGHVWIIVVKPQPRWLMIPGSNGSINAACGCETTLKSPPQTLFLKNMHRGASACSRIAFHIEQQSLKLSAFKETGLRSAPTGCDGVHISAPQRTSPIQELTQLTEVDGVAR